MSLTALSLICSVGAVLVALALLAGIRQPGTNAVNPRLRLILLGIGTFLMLLTWTHLFFIREINPSHPIAVSPQVATPTSSQYPVLERLLISHAWREANRKTFNLMRDARHRENGLTKSAINQFPCQNLRDIDRLWMRYSQGAFGFSVQRKILDPTGSKLLGLDQQNAISAYHSFALQVGWRDSTGWKTLPDFTVNAPKGHLPRIEFTFDIQRNVNNTLVPLEILLHAETCKL
jgi:hypothetical protein